MSGKEKLARRNLRSLDSVQAPGPGAGSGQCLEVLHSDRLIPPAVLRHPAQRSELCAEGLPDRLPGAKEAGAAIPVQALHRLAMVRLCQG